MSDYRFHRLAQLHRAFLQDIQPAIAIRTKIMALKIAPRMIYQDGHEEILPCEFSDTEKQILAQADTMIEVARRRYEAAVNPETTALPADHPAPSAESR